MNVQLIFFLRFIIQFCLPNVNKTFSIPSITKQQDQRLKNFMYEISNRSYFFVTTVQPG